MTIDSKKFAFLTAALAASVTVVGASAGGCSSTDSGDDDGDGGNSSGGETTSSSGAATSSSSSGGASSSSGGGDGGGSSSSSGNAGDGGSDAGTCPTGAAIDADAVCVVDEASQTCSGDEYWVGMCRGAALHFAPTVAAATIDCLKIAPACEAEGYECLPAAVAAACDDGTAATFCAGLAEANECDPAPNDGLPYTVDDCIAVAKAMTAEQRTAIGDCFAESKDGTSCTDDDVGYCFTPDPYEFDTSDL